VASNDGNEVEIKFLVDDVERLTGALRQAGLREKTPFTFESNTLYDTPAGELRRTGQLLRLRIYGERTVLTHKSRGNAGRHKSRAERETEVADAEQMHEILTALGYEPTFRYEKYRAEWTDGEGEVVVDRTPIGEVAEIEGRPDWIDHVAKLLNVHEHDYITSSYAQLFLSWKASTGSLAEDMTFEQCGTPHPSAGAASDRAQ